jgi:hypothetical protein
MTSPQRLRANRANSRRSTGPKTQAGRAKSAQNARRRGLRVPVLSERALADEVEHLAQKIIDGSPPELMDLARTIAEAKVDVLRVRRVRNELVWGQGMEKLIKAPAGFPSIETSRSLVRSTHRANRAGNARPRWGAATATI